MSFATTPWNACVGRRVVAATLAAALQGVFYFLIRPEPLAPTTLLNSTPLEIAVLQTLKRFTPPAPPPQRRPEMLRQLAAPRVIPLPAITVPITLPRAAQPVSHASVDWQQAMQREVREQSRSRANELQLGFLRPPPISPAAPPAFGWDYAHTHRLVALPEGGMLINLTDRCALVLYGLLFPVCKIGSMPTNGHLFDHLHDGRSAPPSALP